jgi:DNA-binding transcriptional LysR family regulator
MAMAKRIEKSGQLSQISLHDLEMFLEVARTQSIRETARRSGIEAGQVSRLLKRLEGKIGSRLLERNASGVSLTQQGSTAVRAAEAILREAGELAAIGRGEQAESTRVYGIGSASFLCARLLSQIVGELAMKENGPSVRLIDVAPDQMISLALKGAFDMAMHVAPLDWPRSWQVEEVGEMRWHLYARKDLGVPSRCSVQSLKKYAFIYPVYWTNEGLIEGNDQCPLRLNQRKAGIATSTAETALAVLKASDQLAFLPEILAREAVESGEISAITVREWKPVVKPLYLAVRSDVVPNRLFGDLGERIRKAL